MPKQSMGGVDRPIVTVITLVIVGLLLWGIQTQVGIQKDLRESIGDLNVIVARQAEQIQGLKNAVIIVGADRYTGENAEKDRRATHHRFRQLERNSHRHGGQPEERGQ